MARDITEEVIRGQPSDETLTKFYLTLARALTMWQRVELALHEISRIAIHPELPGAFSAAFHSLQHTQSQLRMTEAAVTYWCGARLPWSRPIKGQWDELYKRFDKCLGTRNHLAHFSVYVAPQKPREHEKLYLEPAVTDTRFAHPAMTQEANELVGKKPRSRFTVTEIAAAEGRFLQLSRDGLNLAREMVQLEERHAAYLQPPP
jgi:hypothetical protein